MTTMKNRILLRQFTSRSSSPTFKHKVKVKQPNLQTQGQAARPSNTRSSSPTFKQNSRSSSPTFKHKVKVKQPNLQTKLKAKQPDLQTQGNIKKINA